jgi:hypothetical protein
LENRQVVEQPIHPALALIRARPALFVRQGTVVADWRRRGARRLGPYHRLAYREARRQRSIYLGRDSPLVAEVRQALSALQTPWKRQRQYHRLRRDALASLGGHKRLLDRHLGRLGLRLQGFEVRGWRNSFALPKIR